MSQTREIHTLGAMLRNSAATSPKADALVFPDGRLSHEALNRSALSAHPSGMSMTPPYA